jgi:pyruvate formate lyase activating enzyme
MTEAMLYEKQTNGNVRCGVCPHHCVVKPGARGICGVRENRDGVFYALNDGLTISAAIDPIEKKPLYHFLPGTKIYSFATVGCNLKCAWCQNWEISQHPKPKRRIAGTKVTPDQHVRNALEAGCPAIAYTYTEPTIFLEYALETMKLARQAGLKNVWVTNGYTAEATLDLVLPWLDAANVDVKGTSNHAYERHCGGSAAPVLATIKRMKEAGVHLEITTLVIEGVNDSVADLTDVVAAIVGAVGVDVPWHISRFFPNYLMNDKPITPLSTLRRAEAIGRAAGLKQIHLGNV